MWIETSVGIFNTAHIVRVAWVPGARRGERLLCIELVNGNDDVLPESEGLAFTQRLAERLNVQVTRPDMTSPEMAVEGLA